MENEKVDNQETLSIYIAYDDFLAADQLARMVASLDKLYNALLMGSHLDVNHPLPLESRMRIKDSRTGNSLTIELIQGVMQVWEMGGPTLQITTIAGVVTAMSRIVISFAKGFAEFRKSWHEGTKAKHEAKKAEQETERLKRELEKPEKEKLTGDTGIDIAQMPIQLRQKATEAAFEFLSLVEYSSNITAVKINDTEIVNKRQAQ